jgi:flavin reductase (DIM6/NTAB) family NADH-FMN oxidoreductase RutF
VTTVGPTGVVNAAPYSFFNVFCEDPPLCMFAVNLRPDGRVKDTLINIQRTAEFVVNLTDEPLARAMHDSSGDFPPDIGEPDYLGLKLAPSTKVAVPRLADAPWAMECKVWKTIDVNGIRQLIMGEGINSTSATICGILMACACTWSVTIRSAACSPTAIAAPTTGLCFPRRPK